MSRSVYYFNQSTTAYTFVVPDTMRDPCELEFLATRGEVALLRKPRAMMCSKSGQFLYEVLAVTRVPGPPVDGKHLIRVEAQRVDSPWHKWKRGAA